MITASDAVLAALGLFAAGAGRAVPAEEPEADPIDPTKAAPSAALLAPGEPYFEAVAAALRRNSYLDS